MRPFLVLLLVLWLSPNVWADPSPSPAPLKAAEEFRRLRLVKGHFQGAKWRNDVDRWGGRKHLVMQELGDIFKSSTEEKVVDALGPPDHRATPGSSLWSLVGPSQGDALLIYEWRGKHDFLYFLCESHKVLRSGWWMALE